MPQKSVAHDRHLASSGFSSGYQFGFIVLGLAGYWVNGSCCSTTLEANVGIKRENSPCFVPTNYANVAAK